MPIVTSYDIICDAGAQAAEQRPLVVRGPAGQRRAVDRERRDGEVEDQPDVEPRDLQRDGLRADAGRSRLLGQLARAQRRAERMMAKTISTGADRHDRRQREEELVAPWPGRSPP